MTARLLSAALLAASVYAASYKIDPGHSSAQFSVRHMMVSNVKGTFGNVTGTIDWDPAQPTASKVEATIDATTIDTRQAKRDADLRSEQFFDVAKYPNLTFRGKSVSKFGDTLRVTGDLTMRGVTKEVVLTIESMPQEIKDPRGGFRFGASATAKISRKEWGFTYNPILEAGGVAVGDEVSITLDIEATRK